METHIDNPHDLLELGKLYPKLKKQRDELLEALRIIEDNAPEMGGDWATMKAQSAIKNCKND